MSQPSQDDRNGWCELRAHDRIIRYRCSGAGRSLLVLGGTVATPDWMALLGGADGGFRVITPEIPAEDTDLPSWVGALLEGLGTPRMGLIASERFRTSALEIARSDPDQVACMVLLSDHPEVADAQVPVLVVDPSQPAGIESRVRDFLGSGAAATA